MMRIIKEIFKGMLIGIANIIPGVSGGTMAVSMGVYDKIILAITGIRKNFKQSIQTLLPYVIGAVIGIGAFSFIVKYALSNHPLPTGGFFIGLILGGVPVILKKVAGNKTKIIDIFLLLLFFALVIGMSLLNGNEGMATDISIRPVTILQLFLVGIIASATMVIPGVSGSLVLMILGFYSIIVSNIGRFLEALAAFDIPVLLHGAGVFFPLAVGILLGIGVIAKLIEYLFKRVPVPTYYAILGLVFGSPVVILYETGVTNAGVSGVITTLLTLSAGFCISFFLGKE